MNPISQAAFERMLRQQKDGGEGEDLAHLDLSGLVFAPSDLAGTTIAMSRFPPTSFDRTFELDGVTWIGNELNDCSFVDVSLNKSELLDCVLTQCLLKRVALFRADLTGTTFDRCTLEDLDLSQRACLLRVSLRQCTLKNVKLTDTLTLNGTGNFRFDERGELVS